MMNNYETSIEVLFEKAEDCGKTTIELLKLKAIDKSAEIVSSFAMKMAFFVVAALFVVIMSIGFSMLIGEILGKSYYGFFVVAGCYAFLAIVLQTYINQWIKVPVSNFVINLMLNPKTT